MPYLDNHTENCYNFSVIVRERKIVMKRVNKVSYKIDDEIIKNYVETINSVNEPIKQIKQKLKIEPELDSIYKMALVVNKLLQKFPDECAKICMDVILQIIYVNNGLLSTRMIELLNINRQYLSIMIQNHDIERISRGIYVLPDTFLDSYFSFQQKYKKAIFSHMNALYFHGLTEEFPYNYTVTVPQRYHDDAMNQKCNVFYVSSFIYEIGVVEVTTPNGNKIKAYDKERCICDIIRSKGRMDPEQVKKSIRLYLQSNDKDMTKLSEYANKMGISEKVMEMVGVFYE